MDKKRLNCKAFIKKVLFDVWEVESRIEEKCKCARLELPSSQVYLLIKTALFDETGCLLYRAPKQAVEEPC
jgi:hypothetical protein